MVLPRPKELTKGYPVTLDTVGDQIRKKRLDLGSTQLEVVEIIGVKEGTSWNWEHRTEPELRHMPKIIKFLGYVPFECPDDPIGKLKYFKLVKGLSYERLDELMGRDPKPRLVQGDPKQLTDWLSGRIKPCRRNVNFISYFIDKIKL